MFKNNVEDESDFCEAYKSQILNHDTEEKASPIGSILIILLLLVMIVALSIFGYNYIMDSKGSSESSSIIVNGISDDELKVTNEVDMPVKTTDKIKTEEVQKTLVKSFNDLPKSESLDVDDLADKIKIDMSLNEEKNSSDKKSVSEESKEVDKPLPLMMDSMESKYIEDLAKLTEEIDNERK